MKLHLYGLPENPKMLLIHGMLTPWQIWEPQVQYFKERYQVFVVELDGHTQDKASRFVSVEAEAEKIEKYCEDREITGFDVVCGLSMGGVIAYTIWKNQKLRLGHLIMDGALLMPAGRIVEGIMTRSYLKIVHKSQKRDPKTLENFKKDFLPEKYMEPYLALIDLISDTSIENIVHSTCRNELRIDIENDTKILYIHGTKANEALSQKSAKILKEFYPETEILCFMGDSHGYKAVFEPDTWIAAVEDFLNDQTEE